MITGPVCSVCGTPLVSENVRCLRCRETEYFFDRNISLFEYRGTARDLIYLYKFDGCRNISYLFSEMVNHVYREDFHDYIVIPSPSSRIKKRKKGWDQVEKICRILKKDYSLPVLSALHKKNGLVQKTLSLEERKVNLKNRITVRNGLKSLPDKVLLLDDIFTTGATANECSGILKENGVSEVVSLTLAID